MINDLISKLLNEQYKDASAFLDQFISIGYVCLYKTAIMEERIKAKKDFESYVSAHWIGRIEIYDADSDIFRVNARQDECQLDKKILSFAFVNTHHTNAYQFD